MPISFGTSTTLRVLPFRLGALTTLPPSYGLAFSAGAAPWHGKGLVGSSSPPVHPAARASPAVETIPSTTIVSARRMFLLLPPWFGPDRESRRRSVPLHPPPSRPNRLLTRMARIRTA